MTTLARISVLVLCCALLAACGGASAPAASQPPPQTALLATSPSPVNSSGFAAPPASQAPGTEASASPPAGPTVTVPFADNQVLSSAPIYVGLDRGYFRAEGLDVPLIPMNTIPEVIQAVASSQVAFATANPDPALFNAFNRGLDIRLLASLVTNRPGDRIAAFLVRKDLMDSGRYKSLADLKGMKVAAQAGQGQFYIDRMLSPVGLSIADLQIQDVPQPDLLAAFANKSIDAAWGTEPFDTAIESRGLASPVAVTGDLFPGAVGVSLALSPNFARNQADASQRFVYAFLKALRDYYHAFVAQDASQASKQAVIDTLIRHTPVKDPKLYDVIGLPSVDPNGTLNLSSWDTFQDYFIKRGLQQSKVDLSKYEDGAYIQAAIHQYGREGVG